MLVFFASCTSFIPCESCSGKNNSGQITGSIGRCCKSRRSRDLHTAVDVHVTDRPPRSSRTLGRNGETAPLTSPLEQRARRAQRRRFALQERLKEDGTPEKEDPSEIGKVEEPSICNMARNSGRVYTPFLLHPWVHKDKMSHNRLDKETSSGW
ncbi:hypothetical protein Trydic_g15848 [Trypoxylus dichotomus]